MKHPSSKLRSSASALFLVAGALSAAGEIHIDGRVVETKAAGACTNAGQLIPGHQRYVDCGNGTIWDLHTSLLWLKNATCANLAPHGNGTGSYLQANNALVGLEDGFDCDGDGTADLTDGSQRGDWRLPTQEEWEDTIDYARFGLDCVDGEIGGAPSLTDETGTLCFTAGGPIFLHVSSLRPYWSSTTADFLPGSAWVQNLFTGVSELMDKGGLPLPLIWPVRRAQSDPLDATARVEDAVVETAAEGPCFGDLGIGIERYVDCGDGTVLDTVTGLLWLENARCTDLPAVNGLGQTNWVSAMEAIVTLATGKCGLSDGSQPGDWRLPTEVEWEATMDRARLMGCTHAGAGDPPALTNTQGTGCLADGPTPFSNVLSDYWTSTLWDYKSDEAKEAKLSVGFVFPRGKSTTDRNLWPVRERR